MPLSTARPPAGGIRAVQNAITRVLPQPDSALRGFSREGVEDVAVSVPHPVYTLGLRDVAAGAISSTARLEGWRYLLIGGEQAVAAAEVAGTDQTGVRFSHFNDGPFVGATLEGLGAAEALREVKSDDYEVRLLKAPALYLIALWLHGREEEIYLPLPPVPSGLKPLRAYREKELLEVLRPAAAERLRFDDRPEAAPKS